MEDDRGTIEYRGSTTEMCLMLISLILLSAFSSIAQPMFHFRKLDVSQGLRYSEFVVPLVKAVQEQQDQIEDLKEELIELKNLLRDQR